MESSSLLGLTGKKNAGKSRDNISHVTFHRITFMELTNEKKEWHKVK